LEGTTTNNYKFRDLKIYSSTEWLYKNKKRYRQVFERSLCSYIYAEFSFYNKNYDVEDWDMSINLKCFSSKRTGVKEICSLNITRKISKTDHIVYIREGWGNKKIGTFWRKGLYYWEVYVDEVAIRRKDFYIEDAEKNSDEANPYLDLKSIRLFEGTGQEPAGKKQIYYKKFSQELTRFIYLELKLDNKLYGKAWYCELFFKHFNEVRELKGEYISLQKVEKKNDIIAVTAKWGSNIKGQWRKGQHWVDIVFMERVLVSIPFHIGEEHEKGVVEVLLPENQIFEPVLKEEEPESFEDVMVYLDALIGLEDVKRQVREHAQYIQFLQLRKDKGFEENEEINIHSVFIGNPGTGKTTVAKMMGKLYKKMGLLSRGHVHEVDRVDLVGEYIGQTAPKVKEAIEKARGGVLFIDEAYSLARSNDDSKDFGREVIEILIKEMSDGEGDMAVIVAGYPKEMKGFLDSNPGLKSRFKIYFTFNDYLPQELSKIADYACERKRITLSPAADKHIKGLIVKAFRGRDRSFGNARFVYDTVEKAKVNLGLRVMALDDPQALNQDELSVVQFKDVEQIQVKTTRQLPNIPVDEAFLKESMKELHELIGMDSVKQQIDELVNLVRYYRETSRKALNKFHLHTVLVGNPGTGKTTVARILTKIYKALGVLERGHIVETDRQGLVAGFVGQTATKTAEKIDEAMGGVLFIDEAYALNQGHSNDFGNEAIQTLLKRMEDNRGEFFVFAAGYPENMDAFLKVNPGLRSRFDKVLKFEDYSPQELLEIALMMFKEEEVEADAKALAHLVEYLNLQFELRDKYFGNARTVRSTVSNIIKNQNLRLSKLTKRQRTQKAIRTITFEDVNNLSFDKEKDVIYNKKTIGFERRRGGQA